MYLPQYHRIPENDKFWGEGFTDWTTVKNSKPLYKGHNQPRIPYLNNYYDLSIEKNVVWQAKLAKINGIDGFGIYHYWFNNDTNLLTKPAEIMRDSNEVDIDYFLAWDNASWVRSWSNVKGNAWAPNFERKSTKGPVVLIPYVLGEMNDWKNHFVHLLSHFRNPRYIKVDNKPVFMIFNYDSQIESMCDYWNQLAIENGFAGMHIIFNINNCSKIPDRFYQFKYEPLYSGWPKRSILRRIEMKICSMIGMPLRVHKFNYDTIWKKILRNAKIDIMFNRYHGAFVSYDDTPRRGRRGKIVTDVTPKKFQNYLAELLRISNNQHKDFIFITAWNEWGEGAYLEPDSQTKFDYLAAIKSAKYYNEFD